MTLLTAVGRFVDSSVSSQELGEGSLCGNELLVRAHLRDLALHHDHDQVSLGEVAQPMGDQHTGLYMTGTLVSFI